MPTIRAVPVLAALLALLTGCTGGTATWVAPESAPGAQGPLPAASADLPPAPAGTYTSPAARNKPAKEVAFTISKGAASPATGRIDVSQGQLVRITVTSDAADRVTVTGYDRGVDLKPGKAGSLTLEATKTGLFRVETRASHLVLLQLVVR
ncbi:hypothetical protein ACQP1P_23290 [Dactylosporangium sp. CA-052675]|uniref:hypothetical protein n=1 Tax=Dactylosporangium sp. CA-052675 TaxID=3239927 RepID=UPI003D930175